MTTDMARILANDKDFMRKGNILHRLKHQIALHPYQRDVVKRIYDAYNEGHRRVVLVSSTGSGKTVMGTRVLTDCGCDRLGSGGTIVDGRRVWFVVTINTLISQTVNALRRSGLTTEFGVIAPGHKENPDANIQIVSLQTLKESKRHHWFNRLPHLLVLDECHSSAWYGIANELQDMVLADGGKVLGLTATPFRLSKKQSFAAKFDRVVMAPSMIDLTDMGFLSPINYKALETPDVDKVKKRGGEYRDDELSRICNTGEAIASALNGWERLSYGKRTIIFTVDVAHGESVVSLFNLKFSWAGYEAALVTGDTPTKERDRLFAALADGSLTALVSCNALSTGFDCPSVETALLMRPTLSMAMHMQQVGRVARTSTGKVGALVLDAAGNVTKLGFPEVISDSLTEALILSEAYNGPPGDAPVRICEQCGTINKAQAKICIDCGYEFPIVAKDRPVAVGEFVDLPRIDLKNWGEDNYKEYYRGLRRNAWISLNPVSTAYAKYLKKAFPHPYTKPGLDWSINSIWENPTMLNAKEFLVRCIRQQQVSRKDMAWVRQQFTYEFGTAVDFSVVYKVVIEDSKNNTKQDKVA